MMNHHTTNRASLTRFAWLSIAAALVTILLKAVAYLLTGSVGLLSDALESFVNLAGAIMALAMLTVAARPADEDHLYGHSKAEYFSSGVEGTLILIAAVNLVVAQILLRASKRDHSITLEANSQHLMTDVWTSIGVTLGVGAVVLTGWQRLDPIVALIVAANIIWSGIHIVRKSVLGLMDTALPMDEQATVQKVLDKHVQKNVQYHALRTRQSGSRRFVSVHVLVPGNWTVQRGHELLERIEADIRQALPSVTVFTHLESLNDPASWEDIALDREEKNNI
jgi:divalent metal cation (Fe/Co/Zn/Cd) transporter